MQNLGLIGYRKREISRVLGRKRGKFWEKDGVCKITMKKKGENL